MRLDIRYTTRFDYVEPVRESQNELRACPATDERQQLLSYRVVTTPSSRVHPSIDYWGTRVDAFGIRVPHRSLEIVAEAVVDTTIVGPITSSPVIAELAEPGFCDANTEYLQRSAHTDWGPEVERQAREQLDRVGDSVIDLALALHEAGHASLRYVPGATYVGVDLEEVVTRGEGVCQDYAHLVVAMARSVGLPARYVSGYLFAADDATGAEVEGHTADVQTHAWVEVAIPGAGWLPLDPTNRTEVGERHIKIGHGRDYDDVPPLKGAFSGPGEHELTASVHMRRFTGQHHHPVSPPPSPVPAPLHHQPPTRPVAPAHQPAPRAVRGQAQQQQ